MASENTFDRSSIPSSLAKFLDHHISKHNLPNALNSKVEGEWKSYSSGELFSLIKNTAMGLYSMGVRPGDKVALLAENSPEWVICDYSINSLGAASVPIYVTQMKEHVEFIILNAGVKVFIISSETLFNHVQPIFSNLPLNRIIIFKPFASGNLVSTMDDVREKGKALNEKEPHLFEELRSKNNEDTVASIIYTSGTTGDPKGVVLIHKNLISNAIDSGSVIDWYSENDVALSFLPLSHIFERTIINIYLYYGVPVYFAESIDMLAKNLLEVRPTIMSTVPRMLEKVYDKIQMVGSELTGIKRMLFDWSVKLANNYNHEEGNSLWYNIQRHIASKLVFVKWREAIGGRIRFIISGGAPLPVWIAKVYIAAGIPIVQGYGLTETSPVIAVNNLERNRLGSVGPLIPNVQVKIAEDGEIMVKGPGVMREFYNAPDETKKVFIDGWFCTGDIGHMDNDGFLFITDRKKDLMKKSSGKFIAPGPIEGKLSSNKFIDFGVVVGESRKFVIALIFPNYVNLDEWAKKNNIMVSNHKDLLENTAIINMYQEIIDGINEQINPWERIIKFILIEPELTIKTGELTPTLKVRRRIITEKFKDRIDKLYEEYESIHDYRG